MAITQNRKASHNYTLEDTFEVGMVLTGWEVKAIRAGRAQIKEGYVLVQNAELFLVGAHISPLPEASTHVRPDPVRKRKLLMHAKEIRKLLGKTERAGYTLVPLDLHYSRGYVKLKIALAKGKREYDKRRSEQERDWQRTQQRVLRGKGTKGADAYE